MPGTDNKSDYKKPKLLEQVRQFIRAKHLEKVKETHQNDL